MIRGNLLNDITKYCEYNNITDVKGLVNKMLLRGFSLEKYGETPNSKQVTPNIVEKIVVKEVVKEVPCEVVKEVEKFINVTDDAEVKKLLATIDTIKLEYDTQIKELKERNEELLLKLETLNGEMVKQSLVFEERLKDKEVEMEKIKNKRDLYGE